MRIPKSAWISGPFALLLLVAVVVNVRREASQPGAPAPSAQRPAPPAPTGDRETPPTAPAKAVLAFRGATETETGQPLVGVTIQGENSTLAVSGPEGFFEFEAPAESAPGSLIVGLLAPGFRPVRVRLLADAPIPPRIPLSRSPVVRVLTVDGRTNSIAGGVPVDVRWRGGPEGSLQRTSSGADGILTLNAIPKDGLRLVAIAPWFTSSPLDLPGSGSGVSLSEERLLSFAVLHEARAVLLVNKGGRATIRVRSERGTPIAGADVSVDDEFTQRTKDDGVATFEQLPPGTRTLTVAAEGLPRVALGLDVAPSGNVEQDVVLKAGAMNVFGHVRSTTKQHRPTRIEVRPADESRWPTDVLVSAGVDADGAYTLSIPSAEEHVRLVVWFDGPKGAVARPPWADPECLQVRPDARLKHDLDVEAACTLSVRVVSRSGSAIAGALVKCTGSPGGGAVEDPRRTLDADQANAMAWRLERPEVVTQGRRYQKGSTDRQGAVTFIVSRGTWTLLASHADYLPGSAGPYSENRPETPALIVLEEAVKLRGRLLMASRKPAAGWSVGAGSLAEMAVTDKDGRFVITPVLPGENELRVYFPGMAQTGDTRALTLNVPCFSGMPETDIILGNLSEISGTVRPLSLLESGELSFRCRRNTRTSALTYASDVDPSGSFQITAVVAGTYDYELHQFVRGINEDHLLAKGVVEVAEGTVATLELSAVAPGALSLQADVPDTQEEPTLLWVFLTSDAPGAAARKILCRLGRSAYPLPLAPGSYQIEIRSHDPGSEGEVGETLYKGTHVVASSSNQVLRIRPR